MPPSNAQIVLSRIQAWNQTHPRAPLDANAVLAVARQEGLGGGIGDQGTSFGPWQLHVGGAFPSGVVGRGQEQAWAWSPAGIDYALRHIASVAGGQRGAQAVQSIVTRFERPADPASEVSRALGQPYNAAWGGHSGSGATVGGKAGLGQSGLPPLGGKTSTGIDALTAFLLSKQFEPPQVDAAGTLTNPAVHYEAQPPAPPIDALSLARQYLDSTKGAFTNPGFAQYLHGMNGVNLPGSTLGQSATGTHTATPAAGDLAFFGSPPTHQAVMLDGSHFMHGTNGGSVLRVSSLAHPTYQSGLATVRSFP